MRIAQSLPQSQLISLMIIDMNEQAHASRSPVGDPNMGITSTNPKDRIGMKKPPLSLVPSSGIIHCAQAMKNGAIKYGPYNWRDEKVSARIYIDAAMRHLYEWLDREENAKDSGVHHLGHAMACCAILLDAQENGQLVDDRPKAGKAAELVEQFTEKK